jgi:hypothetical protein
MSTRAVFEAGTFHYNGGHKFYSLSGGFHYGFADRHLFSLTVPMVHTIYNADYGGFENTTGIGDLKFGYSLAAYRSRKEANKIEQVTTVMEITAPTGATWAGRGAGTWLYKPGVIFGVRLDQAVTFYPDVHFQFSGSQANSRGGTDGLPDPEDPERDEKLQNFSLNVPFTFEMVSWQGWLTLNTPFTYSLSESTYFLFLKVDFGKMISEKSAASLQITKFVAGEPRLNVLVQAKLVIFL